MFVNEFRHKYGAKAICRFLKISESGYYRWLRNQSRPGARQLLLVEIQGILSEHPDNENYGVRRMQTALSHRGTHVGLRTVYRTMSEAGLIQSLSGTAHCYDNARMESFFATLKKEKLYQIPAYKMKREEVRSIIFRYIFGYYNTQRINSFNEGGLPPVALRTINPASGHAT